MPGIRGMVVGNSDSFEILIHKNSRGIIYCGFHVCITSMSPKIAKSWMIDHWQSLYSSNYSPIISSSLCIGAFQNLHRFIVIQFIHSFPFCFVTHCLHKTICSIRSICCICCICYRITASTLKIKQYLKKTCLQSRTKAQQIS